MSLYCVCISLGQQCLQLCPCTQAAGGGCWCQHGACSPGVHGTTAAPGHPCPWAVPVGCHRGNPESLRMPAGTFHARQPLPLAIPSACRSLICKRCSSPRPSDVMGSSQCPPQIPYSLFLDKCSKEELPKPAAPGQGEEAWGMAAITQLSMLAPVVSQHPLLDTACHVPRCPLCPQPSAGDLLLGKPWLCSCKDSLLQSFLSAKFGPKSLLWAKPREVSRTCGEKSHDDVVRDRSNARLA